MNDPDVLDEDDTEPDLDLEELRADLARAEADRDLDELRDDDREGFLP